VCDGGFAEDFCGEGGFADAVGGEFFRVVAVGGEVGDDANEADGAEAFGHGEEVLFATAAAVDEDEGADDFVRLGEEAAFGEELVAEDCAA